MRGLVQSLLSVCLWAYSHAAISPLPQLNVTVTDQDLLQFNLTSIFNFGGVNSNNVSCQTRQSPGEVYYYNNSIFTRTLPMNYSNEPEIVNFVSNTTLFAIFDNTNVMVQTVNLDAESFGIAYTATFGTPGIVAVCTDVAMNENLGRLYVVCMTNISQFENKMIYIYELWASNGTTINSFSIAQLPNNTVQHRTQITIAPTFNRQTRQVTTFVLVYDQGISGGYSTQNQWALVLGGADSGNLYSLGYADLSFLGFKALYDLFDVRGSILVTGKNSSVVNATFTMAECQLFIGQGAQPTFRCSNTTMAAPFGTFYGYIGVMNTGQYVEVNANVNNPSGDYIYVCDFFGEWGSSTFIDTQNCRSILTSNIPNDVSVSTVEGNAHQIVISYVFQDSTYAGYTVENFDMRLGWYDLDDSLAPHYVPIGKSLIRVNATQMDIFRMVPPYYFTPAGGVTGLAPNVNTIRIDCVDPNNGTTVTNFITIYVMPFLTSAVYLNNPNPVPALNAYEGQDVWVGFNSMDVMGNDLRLVVTPPPQIYNLTNVNVYDNKYVNIDFNLVRGSNAFVSLRFAGQYAVAKDVQDNIIFMNCQFLNILHLACNETYVIPTAGSHIFLREDIETVFGNLFIWGVDHSANITYLMFYDGVSQVTTFTEGMAADDCTVATLNDVAYMVCAFSEFNLVRGWNMTGNNFASRTRLPDIMTFNSNRQYFCPQTVEFDMDTTEMLEVFSFCPGKDQRILRYRYPPTQNRQTGAAMVILVTSVPINFAYQNVHICSMGTEFVIYSQVGSQMTPNLQSAAMYDDRSQWMFGTMTDDLNIGQIKQFQCVRNNKAFTTLTQDSNQNNIITTYYGNNQWNASKRAFTTFRDPGLNNYKFIESFEFMGMVLHVLTPGGGAYMQKGFALSFINRYFVDIGFNYGVGANNYQLSFNWVNSRNRTSLSNNVLTSSANMNASVQVLSKMNGVPSGVIEIENSITKINGPVTTAYISGTPAVRLIGRLSSLNKDYFPSPANQYTFQWMYVVQTTTVALHRYQPGNTSIFTIFQDVESYVGVFQPPDGVHSYHFANFNNTDNTSLLIAMSTASISNNSLDFIALKGNSRIGIGFSNDNMSMSYDKIRVCPLTLTANIFYVFALNSTDGTLIVFNVQVNNGQISSYIAHVDYNVFDFTYTMPDWANEITLWTVPRNNRYDIQLETFNRITGNSNGPKRSIRDVFPKEQLTDLAEVYEIISIEGRMHNQTAGYLILNTKSTFIYEVIYDSAAISINTYQYSKMPGYDGRFVDGNRQHILQMTANTFGTEDQDIRIDFFLRRVNGGDGQVYWTQHNDQFRPVAMTTCPMNMSHVMLATPFPAMPLSFQQLRPMRLNFTGPATEYPKAVLNIIGTPHGSDTQINVTSIYIDNGGNNDNTGGSSVSWWVIALVGAVLLIAAGGVYAVKYSGNNDSGSIKESGNYQSLAPQKAEA